MSSSKAFFKAVILKFGYDIEGEKKVQMYAQLEDMRKSRHEENIKLENEDSPT